MEDVINENPSSAKGALSGISHSVDYDDYVTLMQMTVKTE